MLMTRQETGWDTQVLTGGWVNKRRLCSSSSCLTLHTRPESLETRAVRCSRLVCVCVCVRVCVCATHFSRVRVLASPGTVAHQAPLYTWFSRQEHWSRLPFPSPGDLPDPGLEPRSPALQVDSLPAEPPGKPRLFVNTLQTPPMPSQSSTAMLMDLTVGSLHWLHVLTLEYSFLSCLLFESLTCGSYKLLF